MHRFRELQRVPDLACLPRRAEEHRCCADLADGIDGHDEFRSVREHQRHTIAGVDALRDEIFGQGTTAVIEPAERPCLVSRPDGIAIAELVCRPLEIMMEQGGRHGNILLVYEIDVNIERM